MYSLSVLTDKVPYFTISAQHYSESTKINDSS